MTQEEKTQYVARALNLRENKMDKYESSKVGAFFRRLFGSGSQQVEDFVEESAPVRKGEFVQEPVAPAAKKSAGAGRRGAQKDDFEDVKPIEPDFQEDIVYKTDYSPYIQQFPDNVIVRWRGPEFERYPHDKQLYLGALGVLSVIIVYAIFTDSILMAIVFILIALTGYLYFRQPQTVTDFAITYDGMVVGRNIYSFDDMDSFWIIYEPPHTRVISFRVRGYFRPYLRVPLHQVDPVIVLRELARFIPEVRQEQGWVDLFERLLRR